MSALPPKADIQTDPPKYLLMTQSGHCQVCCKEVLECPFFPPEQEIAAIVAGLARVQMVEAA